jgi:hypothetical protein
MQGDAEIAKLQEALNEKESRIEDLLQAGRAVAAGEMLVRLEDDRLFFEAVVEGQDDVQEDPRVQELDDDAPPAEVQQSSSDSVQTGFAEAASRGAALVVGEESENCGNAQHNMVKQPTALPMVPPPPQTDATATIQSKQHDDGEQPSAPSLTTPRQSAAAAAIRPSEFGDGEQPVAPPTVTSSPPADTAAAIHDPVQTALMQQPSDRQESNNQSGGAAAQAVPREQPGPSLLWRTAEAAAVCSLAVPIYTVAAGISVYNCVSWASRWRR